MKKLTLTTLLALVGMQAYAEGLTLYGAFYPNVDIVHTWTKDKTTGVTTKSMNRPNPYDNGSRIGIKGSYKLGDGEVYTLSYRAEFRTPFDVDKQSLEPRDAWIAVGHKTYGTLKAGRLLTPDPYWEHSPQSSAVDGIRANNGIRYESPEIGGTKMMAHYIMHENDDKVDTIGRDGYALSVTHEQADKYALGAIYLHAKSKKVTHGYQIKNAFRTSGYYQFDKNWKATAMYQQNRFMNKPYTEKGISAQLYYLGQPSYEHYVTGIYTNRYEGEDQTYKAFAVGTSKTINDNVDVGVELELGRTDKPSEREDTLALYLAAGYKF